jgi:hypothetical protein
MEIALAAIGMIGSTGTAVAGGLSAAATSAVGAVSGASALTLLQGGFTAASVLGSLAGGYADQTDYNLQARQETLQAEREALAIREETLKKIGDARVAFGASGVTLASADPIEGTLNSQADREISLSQSGGRLASSRMRGRGSSAMLAAASDALGAGGNFAASVANRSG